MRHAKRGARSARGRVHGRGSEGFGLGYPVPGEILPERETDALETLRLLATQIPDNIVLLDRDERIQFINWTTGGVTVADVIGTEPYQYMPEVSRERVKAFYRGVLSTGVAGRMEVEYAAPDGGITTFETRASPLMRDDAVDGLILISTDITDRVTAAVDRDRYFTLSLDVLCVVTTEGVLRRVNPAVTVALGWTESEVIGEPFLEFVHPTDREAAGAQLLRLLDEGEMSDFVVRCRNKDGSYRKISWRATAHLQAGLIYAAGRDVTEQDAFESRLQQSQKMEAVGQLAGGMAHDFNNMLLAIMMNAEFARRHAVNQVAIDHIDEATRAAQRAAGLTRQLLTFSRQQPVHTDSIDLNELVEGVLRMLRRTIPATIELDFIPGHRLPRIQADIGQVEQVLINLCINARDALPEGGRIIIETETVVINGRYRQSHPWARAGRYVLLTVTDNGVGMTPEVRERAFEPFFTTKAVGEGTGLGLAMAYGIVQQHNGLIHVYSEEGKGTALKIYLPVACRKAEHVGTKIDETVTPGGMETILVAEDAAAVRSVVVEVLEAAGYSVVTAENGSEAIACAEANDEVALALLDVVMPKMTGPEAAARIRVVRPSIKILFTSGYSDASLFGGGLSSSEVVTKPYQPDDLLRRVRDALDG